MEDLVPIGGGVTISMNTGAGRSNDGALAGGVREAMAGADGTKLAISDVAPQAYVRMPARTGVP
jgi:hypothetical protein